MSGDPVWRSSPAKRFEAKLIAMAGYRAIAALGSTLRWRTEGLEHLEGIVRSGRQPVMAFWHGRILPATYFFRRRGIVVITSENFDGEWIAGIIERFGYGTARGSTSRGGRKALLQLTREMAEGQNRNEMQFLPDIYVPCDICKGARYNKETLQVEYKGKNIAQVLALSVEEAIEFFENVPPIKRKLKTMTDVGLGYIQLGQPAPTLSGGEAQRIKLSRELSKIATGRTIYILDEPSVGLHSHDVAKLLLALNKLVDKGNTVIIIEHNLDIIKVADHLIDLGPEGGNRGGEIIAEGTPEEVARVAGS
jgi:excinuclease ABC subunit A